MSKVTLWIFILLFPLLSGCVISAHNLRAGINSFQVQDYRQAFIRLKPEAEKSEYPVYLSPEIGED